RILRPPETFEEFRVRLQMYLEETVTALLAEPELAQIIQREMELETPLVSDIFENTFLILFKTLVQFFQHAKSKEIIDGSFDVQTVAAMMFSIIAHMTRIDRVNNKYF